MVLQDGLIEGAEIAYQRIIHHLNEINEESPLTDNILIMMTKNLLERIRTIQLLSKIEREESITILTRSFLELQVSLKFILNSNTDQRALSYYYNYKIQTVKNLISMTKSDSSYSLSLNEKDLERLRNIYSILKENGISYSRQCKAKLEKGHPSSIGSGIH